MIVFLSSGCTGLGSRFLGSDCTGLGSSFLGSSCMVWVWKGDATRVGVQEAALKVKKELQRGATVTPLD